MARVLIVDDDETVARVVVSFLLIPRYFAGDLFTAYQLIEKRFGHGLKIFTAALFLLSRALAETRNRPK